MGDSRRGTTDSSSADGRSGSSKARKTASDQDASSAFRPRRAARACDRCRSSKLRCKPCEPPGASDRCDHCERVDILCVYSSPAPGNAEPGGRPTNSTRGRSLENNRLIQLETGVTKLLELLGGGGARDRTPPVHASTSLDVPQSQIGAFPFSSFPEVAEVISGFETGGAVDSHLGQIGSEPHTHRASDALGDTQPSNSSWRSHNSALAPVTPGLFDLASGLNGMTPIHPRPSDTENTSFERQTPLSSSLSNLSHVAHVLAPHSTSPLAPSEAAKSQKSHKSPTSVLDDRYSPHARPIPEFGTASRLAAFADPCSHEAPFRCLTYNPDTYRNAELPGQVDQDDYIGAVAAGGKTPKRGQGDPIDRGVFGEADSRALFEFFQHEVAFFLPIWQEPLSFDFVRHRSSFLLSTILAIAAKCCCVSTGPSSAGQRGMSDLFSSAEPDDRARHGVRPVEEEEWLQIRSLAMSCYFQAIVSKVHCLEDIQAVLLLSLWGLQDRGASPDPWVMTGSAYRLARRLGLHLAAGAIESYPSGVTARAVAGLKTYLALYAFDRFFTVGFGRPETEGFADSTIDTSVLMRVLEPISSPDNSTLRFVCSTESAACISAYVDLARIASQYSRLVNVTLKNNPASCLDGMRELNRSLDMYSARWIRQRSPLASKLGLASRPVLLLYNHIRVCLHSIPLKPLYLPDAASFLDKTRLNDAAGGEVRLQCLRKAEEAASAIIQAFTDDLRDSNDAIFGYAFDYAYMVLSHSAVVLLYLGDISLNEHLALQGRMDGTPSSRVDRDSAMRACGAAITALVEGNRSANFFPQDMAGNLSLIAKESGVRISDWVSDSVIRVLDARAKSAKDNDGGFDFTDNPLAAYVDFSMFSDSTLPLVADSAWW